MAETTLADQVIQGYLATKDVVLLATLNPGGAPLAMPMWFLPDAEAITMLSVDGLQKVRNLRRDPRVCVVAESGTRADIKGVIVQGRADFVAPGVARDTLVDRFHAKYDPHLARLWRGRAMPADRVMFRVKPERVRTWGLG